MTHRFLAFARAPLAAAVTVSMLAAAPLASAQQEVELESVKQRFSYVVGLQLGQRLSGQGLGELDAAAIAAAIDDVMNQRQPRLAMEQMQAAAEAYQAQLNEEMSKQAEANKAEETEFLAANKAKEGVTELPSGVQYKVVNEGEGESASEDSTVTVHYRGTLLDGTEFDSSYSRGQPAEFQIGQVIEGWQKVLPLMQEGDKWEVAIPAAMAYGESGAGNAIGPNETLLFEIELLQVN